MAFNTANTSAAKVAPELVTVPVKDKIPAASMLAAVVPETVVPVIFEVRGAAVAVPNW